MDVPSADNMGTLLGADVAGPKHTQAKHRNDGT